MVTITGTPTVLTHLLCPACGNGEDFALTWIGDLFQCFTQFPDGSRDYDTHDHEGESANIETAITCRRCDAIVAERDVTIAVGPWVAAHGIESVLS